MDVAAYGALHAAGAAVGLALAFRTADRAGVAGGVSTAFLVAGFAGAFVAAKAAALVAGGAEVDAASILRTGGSSGLAVPAALAFGAAAATAFRQPFGRLLDAACAGAAAGLAVARLGCVAAGCCGGSAIHAAWLTSLVDAVGYPRQQPIPIYEAATLAAATPFLLRRAATSRPGTTAAAFAVLWGALRLATSLLRIDAAPPWLVPVERVADAACVVVGAVVLLRRPLTGATP